MKTSIIVRFSFEGMHRWPSAPPFYQYLSYPHRHLFFVEATKLVGHAERDIEFIDFRRALLQWCEHRMPFIPQAEPIVGHPLECSSWSCETLATELVTRFALTTCKVFEDNENGACVEA